MHDAPTKIQFVTGRLAEQPLLRVLQDLAPLAGFEHRIDVLPISVAALMTPDWIARHITPWDKADYVVIPGYCNGDLQPIETAAGRPVQCGPKDLRQLDQFFGQETNSAADYGACTIEILAEINHAPRLSVDEIVKQARQLATAGADVIDIGCEPGTSWQDVGACVRRLRDEGLRVSIDSFDVVEIAAAVRNGAELVLSVNSSNVRAAPDWGCEVVVIPDDPTTLGGLDSSIDFLTTAGVPVRIDPILEPIGLGFAASLQRYMQVRQQYPDHSMLMGIGNITEMTDVDSAAINVLLLAICEELSIGSVLTTQVISWARTSVRECDLARRLVHYAVRNRIPPKRLDPGLIVLRDDHLEPFGRQELSKLAQLVKDHNFRIFAEENQIHILNADLFLSGQAPFDLLAQIQQQSSRPLETSHAFYLGYEVAKAEIALRLGKQYTQDEPLDWGFLSAANAATSVRHDPNCQ